MPSTASGQRLAVARGEQRHPYANPAGVVIRNRGIDIAQHLAQLTSAGQGLVSDRQRLGFGLGYQGQQGRGARSISSNEPLMIRYACPVSGWMLPGPTTWCPLPVNRSIWLPCLPLLPSKLGGNLK